MIVLIKSPSSSEKNPKTKHNSPLRKLLPQKCVLKMNLRSKPTKLLLQNSSLQSKVTCANRRNPMRLVPVLPFPRMWDARGGPAAPITPGTAAVPSWPCHKGLNLVTDSVCVEYLQCPCLVICPGVLVNLPLHSI